jgi:hypothetical protein
MKDTVIDSQQAATVQLDVSSQDKEGAPSAGTRSSDRQEDEHELAHSFCEHTYLSPTSCDLCSGLLVGLWSQGLRCQTCHFNVHRGAGIGGHDDCHAEGLMKPCHGPNPSSSSSAPELESTDWFGMAIKPNFIEDVMEQMDRDIMAHAKNVIVATVVEGERSKKLRLFKDRVVPFLQKLDALEARGEVPATLVLVGVQWLAAGAIAVVPFFTFLFALCWPSWHDGGGPLATNKGSTILRLAMVHSATVLCGALAGFLILSFGLKHGANVFRRKVNLLDQFLREVLQIDAQRDVGVSVAGAAARAQVWSQRAVRSAVISFLVISVLWHVLQPPITPIHYEDDQGGYCSAEELLMPQQLF